MLIEIKKIAIILLFQLTFISGLLNAQTIPRPNHIVIVVEENHAYEQIIGDSTAPYINGLATGTNTALFTQSYALTHPSYHNYLMLYSGSGQDDSGSVISPVQFTTCNLGASLLANNLSFVGYSENEPYQGYLGTDTLTYVRRHNPWSFWQGSAANSIPAASNSPYNLFPSDFDSLPTVSFLMPDLNNDMHNGTLATGDTWLKNNLDGYITWAKLHNSLFILTFDEDDDYHNNHILTFFIGPMVKAGAYSDTITHYNVLRTIEDMYGLTGCANDTSAKPIAGCWNTIVTGNNNLIFNEDISIYPNPVSGLLKIHYGIAGLKTIELFDVLGRKVLQQSVAKNAGSVTVDTKELLPGIYELRLTTYRSILTRKLIKKQG